MTVKKWGEFFLSMPEEVKRQFAFPNSVKDKVGHDPTLERHLTKGSSSQPPKNEDEKRERDRAIQRVLNDLYGLGRPKLRAGGYRGLGAPLQQQGRHFGYQEGRSQGTSRGTFGRETKVSKGMGYHHGHLRTTWG